MKLAIFDLDNTLIAGDSDHAWGEFLLDKQIVDLENFKKTNDQFYQDYCQGHLDIQAYLRFALSPLSRFNMTELAQLHAQFMREKIDHILLPKAQSLVNQHRENGDTLLVITATNRFVTEPIVRRFGIDNLLASDAEIINNRYTGEPTGIPCFADGKVERLQEWLETQPSSIKHSETVFYSDSHNDIPLLSIVDQAIAIDPDPVLREHAAQRGWQIGSLR